jgi:hypothetical protein
MRWPAVALASVASLLVVAAPAGAAGTALYMHINGGQDMPMSPQPPGDAFSANEGFGAGTNSLSCFPQVPTVGFIDDYHTLYAFATPSPIDYAGGSGSGSDEPAIHPSRGILAAVPLEGAKPVLHWYWSTQAAAEGPEPTPVPNVVVQATVRAGEAISVDDVAYNSGAILAEGRSEPALLAGDASQGVEHSMVGGRHVYHFTVPLEVKAAAIPKEGYNVRLDTYVMRDECPADGYLMPNVIFAHTSPDHRPRLELATVQPPAVQAVDVHADNGTWVFDVRANSPWGGVDVGAVTVDVAGPSVPTSLTVEPYHAPVHCHCGMFGGYGEVSTDLRAVWDAASDQAKPGDYVFTVHVANLQGTAETSGQAPFQIAFENESPSVAPAFLVLGLAALAVVLRRRA